MAANPIAHSVSENRGGPSEYAVYPFRQHSHPSDIGPYSYAFTLGSAYPHQGYPPPSDPQNYNEYQNPKKKQVRATQACYSCRKRKQKCNEARPCENCKEYNLQCEYKEVPPSKTVGIMMQVLETVTSMNSIIKQLPGRVENIEKHLQLTGGLATEDEMRSTDPAEMPSSSFSSMQQASGMLSPELEQTHQRYHHHTCAESELEDSVFKQPKSIPEFHTIAAHKLLKEWPMMLPFYQDTLYEANLNYPLQLEERRGCLRPYGRGQGLEAADSTQQIGSAAGSGNSNKATEAQASSESPWGTGYYTGVPPPFKDDYQAAPRAIGSINPEMYMKLDEKTIRRLFDSYCRNLHDLHPFIDKARLTRMVENFITSQNAPNGNPSSKSPNPTFVNIASPESYLPNSVNSLGKRKRSTAGPAGVLSPGGTPITYKLPQRSITNAIILLVLALGRICEHKGPLPGVPGEGVLPEPGQSNVESPPMFFKQSPSSSQSTSSPMNEGMRLSQRSQRPLVEVHAQQQPSSAPTPTPLLQPMNIELIPGLAYYAYASDILGNMHGGLEVFHAQACLLAALYHGQLARVLEAWVWIQDAYRICRVLVLKHQSSLGQSFKSSNMTGQEATRLDLIKLVFWTTLQLESDILAELDLPSSDISSLEDKIGLPSGISEDPDKANNNHRYIIYSAQIGLRKLLNRVQASLYEKEISKETKYKRLEAFFEEFRSYIRFWRDTLPAPLRWEDENFQSDNIIEARLRAKYYGALYVTTRPWLHLAITSEPQFPTLKREYVMLQEIGEQYLQENPGGKFDFGEAGKTANIDSKNIRLLEACKTCVDAAFSSTVVFDKVPGVLEGRIVVSNVFTTAHAQYGNCLVLVATWNSWLKPLVSKDDLMRVLDRTISFLRKLSPLSPSLQADAMILENTRKIINGDLLKYEEFSPSSKSRLRPMHYDDFVPRIHRGRDV